VQRFESADAVLQADGQAAERRRVALRHRWDNGHPVPAARDLHDRAAAVAGTEPRALLLERVGNQATVRFNGITVQQFGAPGDAYYDASKSTQMVVLPAACCMAIAPTSSSWT
jgi:hypothetical protein